MTSLASSAILDTPLLHYPDGGFLPAIKLRVSSCPGSWWQSIHFHRVDDLVGFLRAPDAGGFTRCPTTILPCEWLEGGAL